MGDLLSAITGLSAGIVSGTALCAFYVALGVFSKSAESIGLENADSLISVSAASGGLLGILITLYGVSIPAGEVLTSLFGLFGGIYVGILIACLAEVTDAIPVVKNFGLARQAILLVLLAFVLGKTAGSLVYWLSGVF
jgi:stage V sporulation protein AB